MPDDTRRRSDAVRNRDAVLAAARDALTESADVSLNAIAKRANVANATLYRHFPTREQLVLAVYRLEVRHLVDAADQLLEQRDPADALEAWVTRLAQYAMTKQGLASALQAATRPATESFPDVYDPIVGALGKILVAAENTGSVRPGLRADDVILLLAGLFQMDPTTDWRDQPHASTGSCSPAFEPIPDSTRATSLSTLLIPVPSSGVSLARIWQRRSCPWTSRLRPRSH